MGRHEAARATAGSLLVLVALMLMVVLVSGAQRGGRGIGPQLERLIAENYSENRTGSWQCASRRSGEHFFEFEPPELPLLQCVIAEHRKLGGGRRKSRQKLRVFSDHDLYVVLRGAGKSRRGTFACSVCERRWVPTRTYLEKQTALRQCRYGGSVRGVPKGGHPLAAGGRGADPNSREGVYSRVDGMRCYLATRKGCDKGFVWCHGGCCRPEALFYYPHLQKDAGVGGHLLVDREAVAGSDSRRLLEALRERQQSAGPYDRRDRGGGRTKSLGRMLQDATPEQRRRFFMGDG